MTPDSTRIAGIAEIFRLSQSQSCIDGNDESGTRALLPAASSYADRKQGHGLFWMFAGL